MDRESRGGWGEKGERHKNDVRGEEGGQGEEETEEG